MRNIFTGLTILILLIPAIPRAEDRGYPDRLPLPYEWDYVNRDGYQYAYKMTLDKMAPDPTDRLSNATGTLEIREPGTNRLVYKEYLRPDGCPRTDFLRPQALMMGAKQSGFVVVCDTDEGHDTTLRIFENDQLVTKLDYVIADPNLVWHPEYQSYLAEIVFREGMKIKGMAYLPMIYEWTPISDNTDNGFHPIFNSHSYKQYLQDYKLFKNAKDYGDTWYLLMIATLVATSKTSLICAELNVPPLNSLEKKQVKKYLTIAEDDGYPAFDLSICKRGSGK